MSTSATPVAIRALITVGTAGASAGVTVTPGFDITNVQTTTTIFVGSDDIAATTPNGSSSDQEMATAGTPRARSQIGIVPCAAYVRRGDGDLLAAMDTAYAQMAIFEAAFRADQRIGISGGYPLVVFQLGGESLQWSEVEGVEVLLTFPVKFEFRL